MIAGGLQPVLPAPAGTTTTEASATKSAAATETTSTAAEVLESALSPLGRTIGDEHESDQRREVVVTGITLNIIITTERLSCKALDFRDLI